jgi:integrase
MAKADGLYRPSYRDRETGKLKRSRFWWARDPRDNGKRKSTGCEDREAAGKVLEHWRLLAEHPTHRAAHQTTVGHWAEVVLTHKREKKAEGTAHMYDVKLRHIVRLFGKDSPVVTVTPDAVDRYIKTREIEGAKATTISKELTALVQICKYARRGGAFPAQVEALRPVGYSTGYEPRERKASWPELDRLRVALPADRFAMVAFIVATSARLSEALRAEPDDYDRTAGTIAIHGSKTAEASATIPVVSVFRALLDEAMPHAPFGWTNISAELPRACEKIGVERLTPNDLRRTTASMLRAAGVETGMIARILRHKDSRMIERVYGRVTPAEIGEQIERQLERGRARGFDEITPIETESGEQSAALANENANEYVAQTKMTESSTGFKIPRPEGHESSSLSGATEPKTSKSSGVTANDFAACAQADFDAFTPSPTSARDFYVAVVEAAERAQAVAVSRFPHPIPAVVKVALFARARATTLAGLALAVGALPPEGAL